MEYPSLAGKRASPDSKAAASVDTVTSPVSTPLEEAKQKLRKGEPAPAVATPNEDSKSPPVPQNPFPEEEKEEHQAAESSELWKSTATDSKPNSKAESQPLATRQTQTQAQSLPECLAEEGLVPKKELSERPSECTEAYWLFESDMGRTETMSYFGGKWMMFFSRSRLDEEWSRAKQLYRENKLDNVVKMKVSTARQNPRATGTNTGVIIFYIGRALIGDEDRTNEDIILKQGETLVSLFNYST